MRLLLVCCILIGLTAADVIDLKHVCEEILGILSCEGRGEAKYEYSSHNDAISRLVFNGLVDGVIDLQNLPSVDTVSASASHLSCVHLQGLSHEVTLYIASGREIHCSHVTEVTTTSATVTTTSATVTTNQIATTVEEHTINSEFTTEILPKQITKVLHPSSPSTLKPHATSNPSTTPGSPPTGNVTSWFEMNVTFQVSVINNMFTTSIPCNILNMTQNQESKTKMVFGIVIGALSGLILILIIISIFMYRKYHKSFKPTLFHVNSDNDSEDVQFEMGVVQSSNHSSTSIDTYLEPFPHTIESDENIYEEAV